jgi:hypothetical protein
MFILVAMLLVAIVPTGNFNWAPHSSSLEPLPRDYAICYFWSRDPNSDSFSSMIVSTLLVGFGFASRVVRLHRSLAVNIIGSARKASSEKIRGTLRRLYAWCDVQNSPRGLRRTFAYRPMLAIFLVARVTIDAYSSMIMEVRFIVEIDNRR